MSFDRWFGDSPVSERGGEGRSSGERRQGRNQQ